MKRNNYLIYGKFTERLKLQEHFCVSDQSVSTCGRQLPRSACDFRESIQIEQKKNQNCTHSARMSTKEVPARMGQSVL